MEIGDLAPTWAYDAEKYDCRGCGRAAWYGGVYPDDPNDDLCPDCYQMIEDTGTRYSHCEDCHATIVSQYRNERGEIVSADLPIYCPDCADDHARYIRNYTLLMRVSPRHGYVYLLDARNGYWKIGRSSEPVDRFHKFNVVLPYDLEVVALIETRDMWSLEARLHSRYAAKRVKGEWFKLAPEDVKFIKRMVGIPKWRRKVSDLMHMEEFESWL